MGTLPEPPYYAVIFTSKRTDNDEAYARTAEDMEKLAAEQPGYLGMEHAGSHKEAITISYWRDEESILNWKNVAAHKTAQQSGRDIWYENYITRVCRVERQYDFGFEK